MSTNAACNELLYASADQGPHCRTAQIMHETALQIALLAGVQPRFAEVADARPSWNWVKFRLDGAEKHEGTIWKIRVTDAVATSMLLAVRLRAEWFALRRFLSLPG